MNAEAVLIDPDVNAVYICTYHDTHAPLAIAAARAGKHIFLEKPMALTEAECRAICDAVDKAGVRCMTGFKLRFYSTVIEAMQKLSNPLMLHGQIMDSRWPDDSWANDPLRGGGNVLSQGCHAVDLVCQLAKSKPLRVYAETDNLHHPGLEITDCMSMTIRFESGAIATLSIGDTGQLPLTDKFSFTATDGTRSIQLDQRLKRLTYFDGNASSTTSSELEDGFLNENREFVSSLLENREPSVTHRDGIRSTMILLRAFEASKSGHAVSLEDL